MMSTPTVDLSIIVVAHNVQELVNECLSCVRKSTDRLCKQILFVDNGSSDGTSELIKHQFPEVELIESPENLGFIRANNLAYQNARGRYILMLNSDAFVSAQTLQKFVDFMDNHPECGVAGCRQVSRDGTVRPSARNFPTPWRIFMTKTNWAGKLPFWKDINDMSHGHENVMECDWVSGCFLVVRKDIVDNFGYFLRPDFFMYNDDNDLCLRLKRRGWKTYFLPENVIHLGGATSKKIARLSEDEQRIDRLRIESEYVYFRKNYNIVCTVYHFALIVLFDIIQAAKRLILPGRDRNISDLLRHSSAAFMMLWRTQFGNTSIS